MWIRKAFRSIINAKVDKKMFQMVHEDTRSDIEVL